MSQRVFGKFLDIVCQDPSDSKYSQLHVDIFRFCLIHLRYIRQIPLKRLVNFMMSPTLTYYYSNSTGSSATNYQFFPDIGPNNHV